MDKEQEDVLQVLRGLIVSNKFPTPIWNLSRDYETLEGCKIPFRKFNFGTLEDFLRSLPTLRVNGSGSQAVVEASTHSSSKHITELVSRQKTSKKPVSSFTRRSFPPQSSFRGRGGYRGRGRGRGNFATRPYSRRNQFTSDYQDWDQPSREDLSREKPSWDPPLRDQSSRDHTSRDQPSRDIPSRDEPSWDNPSRAQHSREYSDSDANDVPSRHSPTSNSQGNTHLGGPLTVKVDADDKRQVTWKKNLPPRLQRLRKPNEDQPNEDIEQNADIPQPSPASPRSEGFHSTFFLNQSNSTARPSGPSQVIELAKRNQAKQLQQQQGILLQPVSRGINDLAANFSNLSIQAARGDQHLLNGQDQILEDPSVLPSLRPPDEQLLPEPDYNILQNNTNILLRYCISRNWPEPIYTVKHRFCSDKRKTVHFGTVKVNGEGAYTFQASTLPEDFENASLVKGCAAKKALEKILEEESKKVKADKIISSDPNTICSRISDIVAGATNGLFARSVEDEYIKRHKELLPEGWLQTVSSWPSLSVESTINSTIIVPRILEEPQFDPTVPPPPLAIEALGVDNDMEDVYITHATAVNNVWFRVIGPDYSDAYEDLLKAMDTYYKGIGAQEQALAPEIGQFYAAHDVEFDTWFRVCVTEVDEGSHSVLAWLVDHGDNDRFPFNSLYRLAPQFCQLPRQAVLCSLDGLEDFIDDEVANEVVGSSEILIGKSLIAKFSEKDVDAGFVKATLYDTSSDEDVIVNDQIKDEIIARAEPVLLGDKCIMEVAIGDVSKKGEVYIMFNSPSLDRIAEIINSLGPDKISEHKLTSFKHISLSKNKMYLAKYSKDDTWYRAVVTAAPSVQHNKIPVRFVDYGNTESVSISDIADLEHFPSILRKLPAQAMKVALHNLPVETLQSHEVARLHSLLLDEDKVVIIKCISVKADPPIVEIFTKENENGALVSVNSTIELQRKLMNSSGQRNGEKNNSFNLPHPDANFNQLINNQDEFVLQCPDLSNSKFEPVLVVLVAHPGNFIFHPLKYAQELKKQRKLMAAYYDAGTLPELPAERIVKNKLFAARYTDNLWYRVLVTDSPMGSRVPVRLCDHGDVTCVTVSSMRELAPEFHEYPFMAVKGKLAKVVPKHKDWSVEDCIRFKNLVMAHPLAGLIVNVQKNDDDPMDMIVTMDLIDTTTDEDKHIGEILIQEQRAVRES